MTSIFTPAEAQAFRHQGQTPLATGYTDAELQDAADRITADFAAICGVAFVPTTVTREVDTAPLATALDLPDALVTAVGAVEEWDGAAWVASTLGYRLLGTGQLATTAGYWPSGTVAALVGYRPGGVALVRVTYTHGYATPPAAIKRAALILAVEQLTGSNISARATQQTDQNGTFNLAVPGWRENQWYGLPEVDSTLARYRERTPGIG